MEDLLKQPLTRRPVSPRREAGSSSRSSKFRSPRMPLWTGVLAVLASLITLVVLFPANWAAHWLESKSGGRIFLADARGSVWNGSGVLAFSDGFAGNGRDRLTDVPTKQPTEATRDSSLSLPGRLEWTLRIASGPSLVLALRHDGVLAQPLAIRLAWSATLVEPGEVTLPLSLAAIAGAPLNTLRPSGSAHLRWNALTIPTRGGAAMPPAAGVIDLTDVRSAINPGIAAVRPLGDYRIDWSTGAGAQPGGSAADRIEWRIQTLRGPLRLEGQGSAPLGGRAGSSGFSGRAMIEPGTPEMVAQRLRPLLDVLGRRSGNGDEVVIQVGS